MRTMRRAIGELIWACVLGLVMQTAGAAEPLHVVYFEDYEPLSWSVSGAMRGVLIDIVDEAIGKRLGIAVDHRGYPWARAQAMVKSGDADAFVTVVTPERSEYTVAGEEAAINVDTIAFISAQHPRRKELEQVKTLDDLRPFIIGTYVGNGWAKSRLTKHKLRSAAGMSGVFRLLEAGQVDTVLDAAQLVRYHIHKMNLDTSIVELPPIFESVPFRLCIGKNSRYVGLLGQFDQAIRAMRKDGTLDRIYNKYQIGTVRPAS